MTENLLHSYDLSPNVMENLHKRLLNSMKRRDLQSFRQIVKENSKKRPVVTIVRYVDPNTEDTYLDVASRQGLTEFAEFLLCQGAEVNRVNDIHSCAPIHFAAKNGHVDTLAVLLARHATDPDLEVEQRTALHIAVEKNDLKCADLLLEKGASAGVLNNRNLTALHLAATKGQRDMVRLMLDKYAPRLEVDRYRDFDGRTTREVIEREMPEMKEELSEKLPFKDKNWVVNAEDLKYYLNDEDEANFLKCMKIIGAEIPRVTAENLLTISAQYNLRQAVTAILQRFDGKCLNVRRAARATVQGGHHVILGELLKVEPELGDDLLLRVCQELIVPKRRGDDDANLLKCLELILEQSNVDVRCTDSKHVINNEESGLRQLSYNFRDFSRIFALIDKFLISQGKATRRCTTRSGQTIAQP